LDAHGAAIPAELFRLEVELERTEPADRRFLSIEGVEPL
jgi:hypothetical protein